MVRPKPKLLLKSDSNKYTQKPHFVAFLYYTKIVLELYNGGMFVHYYKVYDSNLWVGGRGRGEFLNKTMFNYESKKYPGL